MSPARKTVARLLGPARDLVVWALLLLGMQCILLDVVRLNITGLAVAGAVLLALALWIYGVFTREFWVAEMTPKQSADLQALDQERSDRRKGIR